MSRMPVKTFLSTAKRHLEHQLKTHGSASFVVGNESADLDSITCALVYSYIQSSKPESRRANQVTIPITNIPSADLKLRPELTALLKHADMKPSDLICLDDLGDLPMSLEKTEWMLVDHNALTGPLAEHYSGNVMGCIDHHDDESFVPKDAQVRIIGKSGSCNSLVVNYLRPTWDDLPSLSTVVGAANGQDSEGLRDDAAYTNVWDAQVAKLALGSILIDTFNLKDESKVTDHDLKAVKYLKARINISRIGKDYDRDTFFNELQAAKADLDDLSLDDILRKDYKQWSENGMTLGVASAVKPISYLQAKSRHGRFIPDCVAFAKQRKLDIFAVMTAYTSSRLGDGKVGEFQRQLLLIVPEEGKAMEAAEKFKEKAVEELQLQGWYGGRGFQTPKEEQPPWKHCWAQGNVGASRKMVGPMLREAMRGV